MLRPVQISRHWRFGFEIEVVLGALDDQRFFELESDPMDMASPIYCQAVAKALSRMTGHSWIAPMTPKSKPGYYVFPEYDLDPINFPDGIVAGVELITPPLALQEADDLRHKIADAVEALGGWPSDIARRVGSGDADFGFSFDLSGHTGVELLAEVPTPLNAMMARDHPLARKEVLSLEECARFPLLFQQDTRPIQAIMDSELQAVRKVKEPFLRSNNLALTKEMIRHGLGIAFYTRLGFAAELAQREIVGVPLIENDLADLRLCMILTKLRRPTVAVSAAIDHFRAALIALQDQRLA